MVLYSSDEVTHGDSSINNGGDCSLMGRLPFISKSCELQVSSVAAQVCTGLHSQYTLSSVGFRCLHRLDLCSQLQLKMKFADVVVALTPSRAGHH